MHRRLALFVGAALVLAGCSSPHAGSGTASATGGYGDKPTITFSGGAPTKLQTTVLVKGSGPLVAKGDLLVADYLGQIWNGKVFDSSYSRGEPAGFPIGVGAVVPGWDKSLVGQSAGSRVLLVLPPASAYGTAGNSGAGIKATDTIVFVVDIVASYGSKVGGDPNAVVQKVAGPIPTITGALGSRPTIVVPKTLKTPAKQTLVKLALGTGPKLKAGMVVFQYEAVDWKNKADGSTWTSGQPTSAVIGKPGAPSVLDGLVGLPVGSRVLVEVPAAAGQAAAAAVVDIVAQPLSAKQTAANAG